MTQIRTHQISLVAFRLVEKHQGKDKTLQKPYGALVHKLPSMILTNGLAHTSGFLLAKGREEHQLVFNDLCEAFDKTGYDLGRSEQFHQNIIEANLQRTMVLTRHALDISVAMRRYVQGLLRINPTGDSEEHENESATESAEGKSS